MPLTAKGKKIKKAMKETYGPEVGERVFYASIAAGKVKGAHPAGSKQKSGKRPKR